MQIKEERGYLIPAVNTQDIDYIDCAIACARSIKLHTPNAKVAILSDRVIEDPIFDYSELLPAGDLGGYANDWQVFWGSPFRQTIKIEADMILPQSIEHWWSMFEHRDIVIAQHARNYKNQLTKDSIYRKIHKINELPDLYNAITYWRVSETAKNFFLLVKDLFNRWETVRTVLKYGAEDPGSTDVVYAVAATILGIEKVTLPPIISTPSIIHMKRSINFLHNEDWTKEMVYELNASSIRIQTIEQLYPFHYYIKDFSKVLNKHYAQFF